MPFTFERDLVLPRRLRRSLGKVFGKLIQSSDLGENMGRGEMVFAIGDVVVGTLLDAGYVPAVAIFDNRTARGSIRIPKIAKTFRRPLRVRNDPGTISMELWEAVRKASGSRKPVGIRVRGEEDLASLACIHFAPMGSVVMYGIRGRGIDIIRVDARIKRFVERVLMQMKRGSVRVRRPALWASVP